MNDDDFRKFARAGALLQAVRIVTEFPDILGELNTMAKGPQDEHRIVRAVLFGKHFGAGPEAIRKALDTNIILSDARKPRTWSPAQKAAASKRMKKQWKAGAFKKRR